MRRCRVGWFGLRAKSSQASAAPNVSGWVLSLCKSRNQEPLGLEVCLRRVVALGEFLEGVGSNLR
jgi:hypothetical protein